MYRTFTCVKQFMLLCAVFSMAAISNSYAQFRVDDGILDSYSSVPLNLQVGSTTQASITATGQLHVAELCDEAGTNCNDISSGLGGATASGTIQSGFPDAIRCVAGTTEIILHLIQHNKSADYIYYRYIRSPSSTTDMIIYYNQATGAYQASDNLSAYDCVTNAWTITDLYAQNRAYNFTGADVSVTAPADITALTDVKTTMTPTDGQVLTWNNTASEWEAADPTGGGATASGAMLSGWPDAIICEGPSSRQAVLYMVHPYASGAVQYRFLTYPTDTNNYELTFNQASKTYASSQNLTGYDCVDNAWSIADIYAQGRGYNFTGADVSVTAPADITALTDVKTTMTPTDGQVLTWNNTASEWEAQDAAGATASGAIKSGWPDAIKCIGAHDMILYMDVSAVSGGTSVTYRFIQGPTSTNDHLLRFFGDKTFETHIGLTGYDCADSALSITDLYTRGQAYNFTGADVSVTAPADITALTDVKTTMTPTDGQVLTWNNTASEWEAADPTGGATASGAMKAGWPDAIMCVRASDSYEMILYMKTSDNGSGAVSYRFSQDPASSNDYEVYYNSITKAYSSHENMSGYDCVTNTWSIADIYVQNRGFNFTGADVSVTAPADITALTDVKTSMTPTDGQVLTWNNTASEWEAADPTGGATASGAMKAGWPDAIKCINGSVEMILHSVMPSNSSGKALYRFNQAITSSTNFQLAYNNDGTYSSNANMSGYDCLVNTWSITDLYIQNRAYNFTGADVSVTAPADITALTDVKTTMTPTDGQVLTWNNTASEWEAADPTGGATASGSMKSSFPDAVQCSNGSHSIALYYVTDSTSTNKVYYRHVQTPVSTADMYLEYDRSTGAYSSNLSMAGYDCVTNSWSIADLYSNNKAYNFTGADVSVTTPTDITALTDVKTAMTPTDGQVLTWNNTASEWEAADPTGGATASGSMLAGFPDAIKCVGGPGDVMYLHFIYVSTSDLVIYRYVNSPMNTTDYILRFNLAAKTLASHNDMSTYDCVTNSWSIADIYAQNRGFNFTGPDGAGAASIDELTDAKHDTDDYSSLFLGNGAGANDDGTDNFNVGVGKNALGSNTVGSRNTAIGYLSQSAGTTAYHNTSLGYKALANNVTGYRNTAIGTEVMPAAQGHHNIGLGYQALYANSSGSDNVVLGYQAAQTTTTGSRNIIIGSGVDASSAGASDELNIGNTIYGDLANDFVGIGVQTPTVALDVSGTLNVNQICDETGANCSDVSAGLGGATASGTMKAGWPDAIKCVNGSIVRHMYFSNSQNSSGKAAYRYVGTTDTLYYDPSTKLYSSQSSMSGYDCVTNAWSIDDLYAQGRAFNFTGPDASGAWLENGANVYRGTGYVGIGTSTPTIDLQIGDGTGTETMLFAGDDTNLNLDIYSSYDGKADISDQTGMFAYGVRSADDTWGIWHKGTSRSNPQWENYLEVTDQGLVGIGTGAQMGEVSPTASLHIYSAIDNSAWKNGLHVGDGTYGLTVGNGTSVGYVPVLNGSLKDTDDYFGIIADVPAASDTGSEPMTSISGRRDDDTAIVNRDILEIANGSTSLMRIKANGHVGIGSTDPGAPLYLRKANPTYSGTWTSNASNMFQISNLSDDKPSIIGLASASSVDTGVPHHRAAISGTHDTNAGGALDGRLDFYTRGSDADAQSPRMTITSAGRVGVGTQTPVVPVHIQNEADGGGTALHIGDGTNGLYLGNATSAGMSPYIRSNIIDTNDHMGVMTAVPVAQDTGTSALLRLSARQNDNTEVVNRDIFAVYNYAREAMKVTAYGSTVLTSNSGQGLSLKSGSTTADHVYMSFFADAHNPNTRSGYFGYASTGTNVMMINNELGSALYLHDNVGIKNASPNQALDVVGSIEYTGTIADVSDRRLKQNIQPLEGDQLEKIAKVHTVSFEMINEPDVTEYGVIAQELEEVYPLLVNTADDASGTKTVNYTGLIAPMIKAMQELKKQNELLVENQTNLSTENEDLKARLKALEEKIK